MRKDHTMAWTEEEMQMRREVLRLYREREEINAQISDRQIAFERSAIRKLVLNRGCAAS